MRSVLVIDDDAETRMMVRDLLTARGFMVHIARDGQHALYVLDKMEPPDLILLDYKMPIMDGKQFLAIMRRIPRLQTTPVVIMSAATREWSGAHLEVVDVLSKPLNVDLLLYTVNQVFARGTAPTAPPRSAEPPPPSSPRSTTPPRTRAGGSGT